MRIFSVDAESDGLYGDIWAIGAVVWQDGKIVDTFARQVSYEPEDEWVLKNIWPLLDLPKSGKGKMREDFWAFWLKHKEGTICLSDFGAPVEAYLFRRCIGDDLAERKWQGPYPMHELGTALYLAGVDPDVDRIAFSGITDAVKHNPVDDARVSLACWLKVTPTA